MKFVSEVFHPNGKQLLCFIDVLVDLVDEQGGVCISILHEPGDGKNWSVLDV
jgi:hypothetical protein